MSIVDAFTPEEKAYVKFSDLYNMIYEAAKAELIESAVNANVPNRYIRAMIGSTDEKGDET